MTPSENVPVVYVGQLFIGQFNIAAAIRRQPLENAQPLVNTTSCRPGVWFHILSIHHDPLYYFLEMIIPWIITL